MRKTRLFLGMKKAKELKIFGFGGHGIVIADIAESLGYDKILFFDDKEPDRDHFLNPDWDYVGNLDDLLKTNKGDLFIAIGDNLLRYNLYNKLKSFQFNFVSLIDPDASVSRYAAIGEAVVIVRGACINTGAKIGNGSIINTNATVGHEVIVEPFCHICPSVNIAGKSSVGQLSWIGAHSSVIQNISIANSVYLGAGSVVVKDILVPNSLYFGNPAKLIRPL